MTPLVMTRRPLTEDELSDVNYELGELAWRFARRASGLGPTDPPEHRRLPDLSDDQAAAARLATLAVLGQIQDSLRRLADGEAMAAFQHGADLADLAAALGVTRQAAESRWGYMRRAGDRVAVVISRRDRVHSDPTDSRGTYGEVGGADQYDSDRGPWPVGRSIRDAAEYAIIAVDGTVRRAYWLESWARHPDRPDKWIFTARGGRALTDAEIDAAYAAGTLPLGLGDPCPTRAGGAYRPHWF